MDPQALQKISYGLYVISSRKGSRLNGQIANAAFQATAEPETIAVCINKQNLTHEFIEDSKVFSISVLSKETPMKFIGKFGFKSGRDTDKLEGVNHKQGKTGAPVVLDNSVAYVEAEVIRSMDVGTHTLFLGRVVDAQITGDEDPMTYAFYHQVKRGTAPKTAPTYVKEQRPKEVTVDRYRCLVCGYVYDPEKGDPESGVKPGTPFEELPEDWVCPVCGAGKDQFQKEE